jgi:hypothetical protein
MSRIRRRIEQSGNHPYRIMFARNYIFRESTRNWLGMPSRKSNPYSTVPTKPGMHPVIQILMIGLGSVFCLAVSVILAVLIRHIR